MDFIREFDELISIGTKGNIEKAILNFDNEFFMSLWRLYI